MLCFAHERAPSSPLPLHESVATAQSRAMKCASAERRRVQPLQGRTELCLRPRVRRVAPELFLVGVGVVGHRVSEERVDHVLRPRLVHCDAICPR
eukprot:2122188-Alexandrium_andersonii.AAC.1